ncbi:hypothetical protein H0H81_007603 [Sphagnurus paluster]|uniref:Uncharacterized protein n=1 Tax=Sphagnurus paluster TaxID=117069 RepID=A0A9P7KKI0_9AGAR|nr:hypothetical protein H0H81_007603 [Sphagnurus paluster]
MDLQANTEVATCLQPQLLLPILVGVGNGGDSIIGYLDTWLTGMCGAPACSNDTLNAVITNVTSGCSAEFGLPQVQQTLDLVQKGYATARKVACLKDGSVNCLTGTLRNIESNTGGTMNLNESNIKTITDALKKGLPSSVVCTDCMKGAYSIINQQLPGSFSDSTTKYATDTCGAAFADGGIPPSLISSAWEPAADPAAPTTVSTTSTSPTQTATSVAVTQTPVVSATPPADGNKKKNAAMGGRSVLSSGALVAMSGLVALAVVGL